MEQRTIKFRGKAITDGKPFSDEVSKGEWVEGYYSYDCYWNCPVIIGSFKSKEDKSGKGLIQLKIEVDPKTVGQFTGLHDKNGKEIWEDDMVVYEDDDLLLKLKVKWVDGGFALVGENTNIHLGCNEDIAGRIKVIGNIHENPELLTPTP